MVSNNKNPRTKKELSEAFDIAAKEDPIIIAENETDLFIQALRSRNRASDGCNSIEIRDKDISFRQDHVFSHGDGKYYGNRKAWEDHLKKNNLFEVGNEKSHLNRNKDEVRGDFNCRKELTEATKQVLSRSH